MIALLALLVLGGGAAGAYFFVFQKADAAVDPNADPHTKTAKHESKKDDHGEGASSHKGEYVELDPLILPIVDGNGVSQTVSMVIALAVPNTGAANDVKKLTPKLKDAYIQDMYGMLSRHAALKGGVLQIGKIKERLTYVTDKVVGDDVVDDVLLQVVQQRPI